MADLGGRLREAHPSHASASHSWSRTRYSCSYDRIQTSTSTWTHAVCRTPGQASLLRSSRAATGGPCRPSSHLSRRSNSGSQIVSTVISRCPTPVVCWGTFQAASDESVPVGAPTSTRPSSTSLKTAMSTSRSQSGAECKQGESPPRPSST